MSSPEPGQCWGILGGVFDPIHRGHVRLAEQIMDKSGLDGILMVPSCDPPHRERKPRAPYEARVEMAELAVAGCPGFAVSRIEATLDNPSFTLETLRAVKAAYPGVDFRFIIGADNVSQLKTWHRWEDLLKENKFLVGHRRGADLGFLGEFREVGMELVETELFDLSSTEIRRRITEGITTAELAELVSRPVAVYIEREGFYR